MPFYTKGSVPWNSLDDNTRGPVSSELEAGYPCGEADQGLFNWTAGYPIGQVYNVMLKAGISDPDFSNLEQLWEALRLSFVWPLMQDLIIYVRIDGNDDNDGSENTAEKAFLTPQAAFNYARRKYVLSGYNLIIKLGVAGTYPGLFAQDFAGYVTVEGDITAPQSYTLINQTGILSSPPLDCRMTTLRVRGVRLSMPSVSAARNVFCQGGHVELENVHFSSQGARRADTYHIRCGPAGRVTIKGDCSVDIGALAFANTYAGGYLEVSSESSSATLALVGTPAFVAFAQSTEAASQFYRNVTFSGGATGTRYSVGTGGSISTAGGGATFLPGDAAGFNSGGYYV